MKRYALLFSFSWLIVISIQAQRYHNYHPRVKVERDLKVRINENAPIHERNDETIGSSANEFPPSEIAFEVSNFSETIILQHEVEFDVSLTNHSFNKMGKPSWITSFKLRLHQFKQHRSPKAVTKTNDIMSVLFWVFGVLFTSALGGFIANVIITGLSTITIIFLILSIVFLLAMVALIVISVVMT